ncbi:hypothetical protein ACFL5Q_03350 [Planctomycetota bacterium]
MGATVEQLERDPGYWWLRLTYAIRRQDRDGVDEARRRLAELGVEVSLRSVDAFSKPGETAGGGCPRCNRGPSDE